MAPRGRGLQWPHREAEPDPDGLTLYRILGLSPSSSSADVRAAYRRLARCLHPDKGGTPEAFAALQGAFETLADPGRRAVYDAHARHAALRRGGVSADDVQAVPEGAEGVLLDELRRRGVVCDPHTQLVVTCEMCLCPATSECWTCGMAICGLCTRRMHWKGAVPLHWPLVDAPGHLADLLGAQEFERKRIEDARRVEIQLPGFRPQDDLRIERTFLEAAQQVRGAWAAAGQQARCCYSPRLDRYYCWGQTHGALHIAVYLPAGSADKSPLVEVSAAGLLVQLPGSPPVIDRTWGHAIASSGPVHSWRSGDARLLGLQLVKAQPGQRWQRLFQGNSDGARCLQPPYSLQEVAGEVLVEVQLPWWVMAGEDVAVDVFGRGLSVRVDGVMLLERSYWWDEEQAARRGRAYQVVDVQHSSWCLLDSSAAAEGGWPPPLLGAPPAAPAAAASRRPGKVLSISLARPPLTQEEVMYKKGVRQDNQAALRSGGSWQQGKAGRRFFVDDADDFGLEELVQAMLFDEEGATWVPPPWPWQATHSSGALGRIEGEEPALSDGVLRHLAAMRAARTLPAGTDGSTKVQGGTPLLTWELTGS